MQFSWNCLDTNVQTQRDILFQEIKKRIITNVHSIGTSKQYSKGDSIFRRLDSKNWIQQTEELKLKDISFRYMQVLFLCIAYSMTKFLLLDAIINYDCNYTNTYQSPCTGCC